MSACVFYLFIFIRAQIFKIKKIFLDIWIFSCCVCIYYIFWKIRVFYYNNFSTYLCYILYILNSFFYPPWNSNKCSWQLRKSASKPFAFNRERLDKIMRESKKCLWTVNKESVIFKIAHEHFQQKKKPVILSKLPVNTYTWFFWYFIAKSARGDFWNCCPLTTKERVKKSTKVPVNASTYPWIFSKKC